MKSKIAPSIMCADLLHLDRDIRALEEIGAEYLHFDIMDGSFVPNFTLGPDLVKAVRKRTNIPLDIHFMVNSPERHLDLFDIQKGDLISVHVESTVHLNRLLNRIRALGASPAVALNPTTPLFAVEEVLSDVDAVLVMTVNPGFAGQRLVESTLDKIKRLREMLDSKGYWETRIEVDGNVSFENAAKMRAAGADIFVAGSSSIFAKGMSIPEAAAKLRESIR